MTSIALTTRGLTKRYGDRTVVDKLDLEVPAGVVAGFVGPNGAGKTTTIAMLLGLVRPSSGTGTVLGQSIDTPETYIRRVGAIIEGPAFYPSLTGRQNLAMFATVAGHARAGINPVLDLVGLGDRGDDPFRTYSLGMKQRLGIAAALIGDPALLILDEPANGLDPQGVREMRELIAELAGAGRTILVSSHDLSEVEQVCDWLVLIERGKTLYQGPTRQLLDSAPTTLRVAPSRAADVRKLRSVVTGLGLVARTGPTGLIVDTDGAAVADVAARIDRAAFDQGVVLAELHPIRTTLEEQFLAIVGGSK